MPISLQDGTVHESELDMLLAKDMPSREDTDRQQKMKDMDSTMPHDMRGPPVIYPRPDEKDYQLQEQFPKDQNSPYQWDMGPSMNRTGPAMIPYPEPKFHDIMQQMDELINPNSILPVNARQTAADLPSAQDIPKDTVVENQKSPYGETYDKFVQHLEKASAFMNPSFIPTAEQFRDAPWKEKLGFILGTSMMLAAPGRGRTPTGETILPKDAPALDFWKESLSEYDKIEHPIINTVRQAEAGGSAVAKNILEVYKKIDDPVVRAEFSKILKDKISSATEGGETSTSNITNPEIKRWTPGEDKALEAWNKAGADYNNIPPELADRSPRSLIVRSQDKGYMEKGRDLSTSKYEEKFEDITKSMKEGKNYADIGKDVGMSGTAVRQLIRSRPELRSVYDETPRDPAKGSATKWTPAEDKILRDWHADPASDLWGSPPGLEHRSEGAVNTRIEQLKLNQEPIGSKPFTPKGAVMAPETGGGSGGPRNTELTGKSGVRTPSGLRDPEFRSLKAMRELPSNQNISPENFGENMATDIIRDNLKGTGKLTTAEVRGLVRKYGPDFEEFHKGNANSRGTSATEFSRYMKKSEPLISELEALERAKMDPYDKAVLDQKKRKDNIKPVK